MKKGELFIAVALVALFSIFTPVKASAATLTVSGGGTGLTSVPNGYCLSGSSNAQLLKAVPCIATTTAYTWGPLQTFNSGITAIGTSTFTGIINVTSGIKLGTDFITKFSNVFNHKAYTVCASNTTVKAGCDYTTDGVADDVQIQAAYEAAGALNSMGGEVVLSAGVFKISSAIKLDKSNVTIRGAGLDATTIYIDNNANVNAIEYKGSVDIIFNSLQSFSIDGNRAHNTSGYGVYISPTGTAHFWDFYVRDVWAKNAANDGFFSYDGHGFVLDHFLSEYNNGDGIRVNGTDEIEIQNGTIKLNGGNGITCANNSCLVQGNEVSDNLGHGIEMSGVSGNAINNVVYLNGLSGIHVTRQPYMKVLNNIIKTNMQHGILVDTSDAMISGNSVFENSQQTPNTYDEIYAPHERVNITNNTIDGKSHSRYGINFGAAWAVGNVSTNNTIINELTAPTHDVSQGATWFNGGNNQTVFNERVFMSALATSTAGSFVCMDPVTHELTTGIACTLSSTRFNATSTPLTSGALTKILALKPVSFTFKNGYGDNGVSEQIGFLAEDAVSVDSRLVTRDKNGQLSGFLYENFTSLLTKAVQELSAKVDIISLNNGTSTATTTQGMFNSIISPLTTWLANVNNNIVDFFANKVHTKQICISDNLGETCITRSQLDALLASSTPNAPVNSAALFAPTPAPEPTPAPAPTDTPVAPEPAPAPTENLIPDPAPTDTSATPAVDTTPAPAQ